MLACDSETTTTNPPPGPDAGKADDAESDTDYEEEDEGEVDDEDERPDDDDASESSADGSGGESEPEEEDDPREIECVELCERYDICDPGSFGHSSVCIDWCTGIPIGEPCIVAWSHLVSCLNLLVCDDFRAYWESPGGVGLCTEPTDAVLLSCENLGGGDTG